MSSVDQQEVKASLGVLNASTAKPRCRGPQVCRRARGAWPGRDPVLEAWLSWFGSGLPGSGAAFEALRFQHRPPYIRLGKRARGLSVKAVQASRIKEIGRWPRLAC